MAQKQPRNYAVKVRRSNKNILFQVIDRAAQTVVFSENTASQDKGSKTEKVQKTAASIAKKLKAKKIDEVLFDRSNHKYHGRVKAAADALRENGITI
jgi:large subunit ribosomal protein L18